MSVPEPLGKLAGNWKGSNRLHTPWLPNPVNDSESTAAVSLRTNGKIVAIEYTWAHDGKPEDGMMLISGASANPNDITMIYTDSWHYGHLFMECKGTADAEGKVNVKGFYAVPENPDWGWRTEIIPGEDEFRFLVYNVSPEGEEDIAVEADFRRV